MDQHKATLGIYLNDHLAGATAGVELARRAAAGQKDKPAGPILEKYAAEIAEDREALLAMMSGLDVPVRHYKVYGAWLGEKVGRLKPNGSVVGRSPLSDLIELEMLRLGVEGKAAGWRALRVAADSESRLDPAQLDELIARAARQIHTLEELREACAAVLFGRP